MFTRDTAELKEDVPDTEEETSAPEPRVYQPPEKITEVLLEEEQPQEAQPNLDFVPTAALEAVPHQETPKTRKKVSVSRRKKKSS